MTTIITISIAATFIIYELFNLKESINDLNNTIEELNNTIEEFINLHNL